MPATAIKSEDFIVCVAMSGRHHERGRFSTLAEAEAFQRELHKQGWYYVPIYRAGANEPFDWAAWDREKARQTLADAVRVQS